MKIMMSDRLEGHTPAVTENEGAHSRAVLPDARTVCDIVLRLAQPYDVAAWLMVETAARMSDIQALRVRDVQSVQRTVVLTGEQTQREVSITKGLADAIASHLAAVRKVFERVRSSSRIASMMFADQLVFPAWMLPTCRSAALDEPMPVHHFGRALQEAAVDAGFAGRVHSQTLRLFAARRWIEQGTPMDELHRRLGHRDILTTLLMVQALTYGGLTFVTPLRAPVAQSADALQVA